MLFICVMCNTIGYQLTLSVCNNIINAVTIKKLDQSLFSFVETVGISVAVKIETCFLLPANCYVHCFLKGCLVFKGLLRTFGFDMFNLKTAKVKDKFFLNKLWLLSAYYCYIKFLDVYFL